MGAYDEPTQPCPYCQEDCEADFVDNGVGMVQCGPYHCYSCGASEIGPELSDWYYKDRDGRTLFLMGRKRFYPWYKCNGKTRGFGTPVLRHDAPFSTVEVETGFYAPDEPRISPYANTAGGVLVDHVTAKKLYDRGLLDEKNIDERKNENE